MGRITDDHLAPLGKACSLAVVGGRPLIQIVEALGSSFLESELSYRSVRSEGLDTEVGLDSGHDSIFPQNIDKELS